MTSRERVLAAIRHEETDRVPVDLGGTPVTGISVSVLSRVRLALGLDRPGDRVRVVEPYQMLGEVTDDLRAALGIDTVGIRGRTSFFGFENKDWKPWELPDGTPVLVPGAFNTEPEPNGDILQYPQGDRSAPPSGRMPKGGYYFDAIVRQDPIDDAVLDPRDNLEEFQLISDADLDHVRTLARRLRDTTPFAVVAALGGTSFGDIALVPAPFLKHPKGIRDVEEWYLSLAVRRGFLREVFETQCEVGLANLARIAVAVGDCIDVIMVTGTDFGTQRGLFASPESYREVFMPFHTRVNRWIHRSTNWATFIHTCGAVEPLIGDFVEAGFDILNPVQCSAAGMDAQALKASYGDAIAFWGGVVDTQHTLPFGTPEEVRQEVLGRLEVFAPGGGFVFNAIHNIQPKTPAENVVAMFRAVDEFAKAGTR